MSYSNLIGVSRRAEADLFDLDTPVKPEYDREKGVEYDRERKTSEGDKNIQLVAACFVTDTTNCSGNEFAGNNADDDNGGVPPGGGDDYELDNEKRCEEEGYTKTSCPEGYEAVNFCPYDNRYFEYCRALCPSDYVTCEEPYYGVGEACGGKYASCECTPCGAGYDNTTISEGYIQDGEACLDCDGKTKYKIKPNPCDGFMDCGNMGPEAGANTCQSGTETLYDNCKPCPNECSLDSCPSPYTCKKEECSNKYCKTGCQSGYVWNASSQTCTCDPDKYKYTCTGTNETGGSGSSCGGKYEACNCVSGYYWDGNQCSVCVSNLDEGWTYDFSECPYGYSDSKYVGNDPSQCHSTKYKCSKCLFLDCRVGQFLSGNSCSDTPPAGFSSRNIGLIGRIETVNKEPYQICILMENLI